MPIDDGGPAFPNRWNTDGAGSADYWEHGMSLRDYFAGQALAGILAARNGFLVDVGTDNAPGWAYRVADAMIEARKEAPDAE